MEFKFFDEFGLVAHHDSNELWKLTTDIEDQIMKFAKSHFDNVSQAERNMICYEIIRNVLFIVDCAHLTRSLPAKHKKLKAERECKHK